MNIQNDISHLAITEIKQLSSGHPVYLVRTANDACVIKVELASKHSFVQYPIEIMNFIDSTAKVRVLNKSEVMRVRNYVQANQQTIEETPKGLLLDRIAKALTPPDPRHPMQGATAVMTIMELKQNMRDLQTAYDKLQGGDKTDVRAIAKALNDPGGLEKLAGIMAADAFTGNGDRIAFDGKGGGHEQYQGQYLKCIINVGNIFIVDHGGKAVISGLDAYDPGNMSKNMDSKELPVNYYGSILRQDAIAKRRELFTMLIDDLEMVMGPRNRALSIMKQTRLTSSAPQRLETGMMQGAQKILIGLRQKYAGGNIPMGIQHRLQALGWLNRTNFPRL